MSAAYYHSTALPWSPSPEDDRRLHRIMATSMVGMILLFLIIPMIDLSDRLIDRVQEVPARFAQLIIQDKPVPPPPPPVQREEVQPQPETKAEPPPESKPESKPAPKPEPVAKEKPPVPKAEPQPAMTPETPTAAVARERAARTGLLALSQELAGLRSTSAADDMERRQIQQRNTETAAPRSDPAVITASRGTGSGGIDTSALARDTGQTQLAARETTRVSAPATAAGAAASGTGPAGGRSASAALAQRTSEEIQMIFDQNKGALNALYNRALRANPGLSGKIVLKLTIEPGGQVSACELVSSQLGDPELERRLLARVQMFDFGARQVAATTITYPIDFFPG